MIRRHDRSLRKVRGSRSFALKFDQLEPRRMLSGSADASAEPIVELDPTHVQLVAASPDAGPTVLADFATFEPVGLGGPISVAALRPGVLHTEADFVRIRAGVVADAEPWASAWSKLIADGYSQLGTAPRPLGTVIRGGTGSNFGQMVIDIQRAYQLALRWKVTGDTRYADHAVRFLNAWSSTNTTLTGTSDRFLASGLYGFDWAVVADIMKTYTGWAAADVQRFEQYLLDVYYPLQRDFLTNHNGNVATHYWANWDLANIQGMMAVGIVTGRQDVYDEAIAYLFTGDGNGALDKAFYYLHPGHLFQWQEAGRDQGHTVLGIQLFGHIAQMAWNQGLDLYAYNNYQFLAAAEYTAKYNLGYEVPYEPYAWGFGSTGQPNSQPSISGDYRGDLDVGYALVYSHYVERLGMAAPYTTERVQAVGIEGRGSGDDMGFGTLTYSLAPVSTADLVPRGLTAREREQGGIQLDWFGMVNATSYDIYRSTEANGPFALVASGISDLLTYTDFDLPSGTYFYKVAGQTATGLSDFSVAASATSGGEVVALLAFDETSGTIAADGTGNGLNGSLSGATAWTPGKIGNSLALNGSSGYVALPEGIVGDLGDFTIATWVNLDQATAWSRIFDFGDDRGNWMYLTPRNANGVLEFATSTTYGFNKQSVSGKASLPTSRWCHVAVTLVGTTATIYVDGVAVASNSGMDFPPFQLGNTTRNWIGRSQQAGNPYLDGRIDDFRIYRGGLPAGQIYFLANGHEPPPAPPTPSSLTATAVPGGQVRLAWSSVDGATSYTIKRGPAEGGPLRTIATLVTGTELIDTGLSAGAAVRYVVEAANLGGAGPGAVSDAVVILPPVPDRPGEPAARSYLPGSVTLSWAAAANAASYTVLRSESASGPQTVLATGVTETTYIDRSAGSDTYRLYSVIAENAAGVSDASISVIPAASPPRVLIAFDETTGLSAPNSAGTGWNGSLIGGAAWADGRFGNSVRLDGTNDYVSLPTNIVSGLDTCSIAAWVNLDATQPWARVFDFGNGTSNYMMLTPRSGDGTLRFAIRTPTVAEQRIDATGSFPVDGWIHVGVTLDGRQGVLYLNGVEVGRNESLTLSPADLGSTTINYLGRSQFSSDPYLDGRIDDFRLYSESLPAAAFETLASQRPEAVISVPTGQTAIDPIRSGDLKIVKRGPGLLVLDAANTHSGGTAVEAGTLEIRSVAALGSGPLTVGAGATVRLNVGLTNVLMNRLDLADGAVLDLGEGGIEIAAGGVQEATFRAWIVAGRSGGNWFGSSGIRSAAAAGVTNSRAIGFEVRPDGSAKAIFTAIGDLDLDRDVDAFDLIKMNAGGRYGTGGVAGWIQGDVNYDGQATVFDLVGVNSAGTYGAGRIQANTLTAIRLAAFSQLAFDQPFSTDDDD